MPGGVTGKAREGIPMSIDYKNIIRDLSASQSGELGFLSILFRFHMCRIYNHPVFVLDMKMPNLV